MAPRTSQCSLELLAHARSKGPPRGPTGCRIPGRTARTAGTGRPDSSQSSRSVPEGPWYQEGAVLGRRDGLELLAENRGVERAGEGPAHLLADIDELAADRFGHQVPDPELQRVFLPLQIERTLDDRADREKQDISAIQDADRHPRHRKVLDREYPSVGRQPELFGRHVEPREPPALQAGCPDRVPLSEITSILLGLSFMNWPRYRLVGRRPRLDKQPSAQLGYPPCTNSTSRLLASRRMTT